MSSNEIKSSQNPQEAILNILSTEECQLIHDASLKILERTGMDIRHPEALELLKNAGADVSDTKHVKIPSQMVNDALKSVPNQIQLYYRNGEPAMLLEGRSCFYSTGTETPYVLDHETGKRRSVQGDDINRAAIVADYLDNIDIVASMGSVSPSEVPPHLSDQHNFARIMANTTKPILFSSWGLEGIQGIYKLALTVRDNDPEKLKLKPFLVQYSEPISPLCHPESSLDKLIFCAHNGLPVTYASGTVMGGTVPVTAAGALALTNAEFLTGLVISQLVSKGASILYGGGNGPLDMKTMVGLYNAPDSYQMLAMAKEMALFYDLPDFNYGGHSDSKCVDLQAATEAAMSIFQVGIKGGNLNHDVGYMESGMSHSLQMVVLCDEIIGQTRHFKKKPEITEESLALDVIHDVGPGGNFTNNKHTFRNFKKIWYGTLFDTRIFQAWEKDGSKPLQDVMTEKVKMILETHQPETLESNITHQLEEILKKAAENIKTTE
jgi:trimethylamine---corrinoid protein Co-methyltransferase